MKYAFYLCLFLLVACVTEPPKPLAVNSGPSPQEVAEQQRKQRLRSLLTLGHEALEAGRLMVPKENSAYKWYMQALDVDQLNVEAHWGMRQITAQYMELAEQAFKEQRRDRAEVLMARAMSISATPQQCADLRAKYPVREPAENEFRLPLADLSARNTTIIDYLSGVAIKARDEQSRLTIVARNDAEGRWIYKQMRAAVDGYRLRGNISIGATPKVVLIDLGAG